MTNRLVPHIPLRREALQFALWISIGFALTTNIHAQSPSPVADPGNNTVARKTVTQNAVHDLSPALTALKSIAESVTPSAECDTSRNHCGTSPCNQKKTSTAVPTPMQLPRRTWQFSKRAHPSSRSSRARATLSPSSKASMAAKASPVRKAQPPRATPPTTVLPLARITSSRSSTPAWRSTPKGSRYDTTGKVLYGPVITNTIFAGFGGPCEQRTSGDAVVRYDQLAQRWLYVLPIFKRPAHDPKGPYSMCYAVSKGPDPLGPYYRYEFKRPLFPDYPMLNTA